MRRMKRKRWEEKRHKEWKGELESQSSLANKFFFFLSHFPPSWNTGRYFSPPHLPSPPLRKRLTFVWSLWEVGIRGGTMGLPTVRGWEEPSQISQPEDWLIRPLSLPSHRPHINTFAPHCPPPSCSGICSPQQPVLSTAVRAEVSHWQFAPNRFVRASNCTAPTLWVSGFGFWVWGGFFLGGVCVWVQGGGLLLGVCGGDGGTVWGQWCGFYSRGISPDIECCRGSTVNCWSDTSVSPGE